MINPAMVLAFSVLTPLPAPTLDASYVFRVPVRIENMRHVTQASVTCTVTLERPGGTPIGYGTTGPEMVWTPVRDGALSDTVTITINLSSATLALGTPVRWSCSLIYDFRNSDGTIVHASFVEGERERVYTRSTGQEITTAVVTVGGPLTPP
jgi:hypothetical protein